MQFGLFGNVQFEENKKDPNTAHRVESLVT